MSEITVSLPATVRQFIDALNAGNEAGLNATFADDIFVNDVQREFWGKAKVSAFARKELLDPKITMAVQGVRNHKGLVVLDALIDGEYDKSALPNPLILTFYFGLEAERIVTLFVIRNRPAS